VLTLDAPLGADLDKAEDFELDFTKTPARTVLGTPVGPEKRILSLEQALDLREQEVVFWIVQQLLRYRYKDEEGRPNVAQFSALRRIAAEWLQRKVKAIGETNPRYRNLVLYWPGEQVAAHVGQAIDAHAQAQGRVTIHPVFNHYNPEGSTRYVSGRTSKKTYPTTKSHVNVVVADTNTWEQLSAKALDELDCIEAYVKNAYLNFTIPYVKDGKDRYYFPDFITRVRLPDKNLVNLIIEVTGMNQDKAEKIWYVEHRWLPAVNAAGGHGRWAFVEVSQDIRTFKNQLMERIDRLAKEDWGDSGMDEDRAAALAFMRAQEGAMRRFWKETEHDGL
jgi:type III restriction enzyme